LLLADEQVGTLLVTKTNLERDLAAAMVREADLTRQLNELTSTRSVTTPTKSASKKTRKQRRKATQIVQSRMASIHGTDQRSRAQGYADYFLKHRELFTKVIEEINEVSNFSQTQEATTLQQHAISTRKALELIDSGCSLNVSAFRRLYKANSKIFPAPYRVVKARKTAEREGEEHIKTTPTPNGQGASGCRSLIRLWCCAGPND